MAETPQEVGAAYIPIAQICWPTQCDAVAHSALAPTAIRRGSPPV